MRIFPIALVVVGVVFLLRNLGFISHDVAHTWWPLILIVVGVAALFRCPRHCKDKACCGGGDCSTDDQAKANTP